MTGPAPVRPVAVRRLRAAEHRLVLVCGDITAAAAAMVVALWLWSIPAGAQLSARFVLEHGIWFTGASLWLLVAAAPATSPSVAFSIRRTAAVLGRGAAIFALGYLALYFYSPRGGLPRLVVLYFLWEAFLLTLGWRLVFVAVFSRERFRQRAVIIGSGPAAAAALDLVRRHRARRSDVAFVVRERGTAAAALRGAPMIDASELPEALASREVSEIILALEHPPDEALLQTLLACQEAGLEIVRVQTLVEQTLRRVPVALLEPDWLMTDLADAMRLREASWLWKRALDLVGSSIGLAAAAVLTPIIAAAIRLDSPGQVFYRQRRLGRGGQPFDLVKFRTMHEGAERPGEARWAGPDDPRITRVGRILRRTRLDELPQLLSVLRGDMSLVGPRPERAEFVERLQEKIPFYRARLMVPPGLTGWAQVNLPYSDSVDASREKLEYDLYYVKHRSLLFDIAILLSTVGALASLRGSR